MKRSSESGNGNGNGNDNGNGDHAGRARGRGAVVPGGGLALGRARGEMPADVDIAGPIRGAVRGRRMMPDLIYTRPQAVASTKKGSSGNKVCIKANYFRIEKNINWTIHKYHIEFSPSIDVTRIRKAVFYGACKQMFAGCIFDGM